MLSGQLALFIFSFSDWRNDDVLSFYIRAVSHSDMHRHMLLRQEMLQISRCNKDINTFSDSSITYLRSSIWLAKFNTENNM